MRRLLAIGSAMAVVLSACGGDGGDGATGAAPVKTVTVERQIADDQPASAAAPAAAAADFDAEAIYRREAPGVVTVISTFEGAASQLLGGGPNQQGLGSGFVLDGRGEIATNAHVVTNGAGSALKRAKEVFVQFADGNQVPAKIIGADLNVDVALIRVDPKGLELRPLPLGSSDGLTVGAPVAAIGSPFGEPQSLSVGVLSGLNRSIKSLVESKAGNFDIYGAIQTDAAINHGNSGGPLVDASGRVLGINAQIESTGGGGEGVGFAVPINAAKRSLDQLRRKGVASYAYLGVISAPIYPQLADHFDLPVRQGAWIQEASSGGPAAKAGLKGGSGRKSFQTAEFATGGDVIVGVDGRPVRRAADLSQLIALHAPGDAVTLSIFSGQEKRRVSVKLGARPSQAG